MRGLFLSIIAAVEHDLPDMRIMPASVKDRINLVPNNHGPYIPPDFQATSGNANEEAYKLVLACYQDKLDIQAMHFVPDTDAIINNIFYVVKNDILDFLGAYASDTAPRSTKIYKFFRKNLKLGINEQLDKAIFQVWKYIKVNEAQLHENPKIAVDLLFLVKSRFEKVMEQ